MPPEKKKGPGPVEDLFFVILALAALVVLWFATGGPGRANLTGIFINPPAAPSVNQ